MMYLPVVFNTVISGGTAIIGYRGSGVRRKWGGRMGRGTSYGFIAQGMGRNVTEGEPVTRLAGGDCETVGQYIYR